MDCRGRAVLALIYLNSLEVELIEQLIDDLKRDEGFRAKPYRCTAGKVTIGFGRNLDDVGVSDAEAYNMLMNDIEGVYRDLDHNYPWWAEMPEPARVGLANMCFNLGISRLGGFRNMLAALEAGEYYRAAIEALDSRWAEQVGARAERIAMLFRNSGE